MKSCLNEIKVSYHKNNNLLNYQYSLKSSYDVADLLKKIYPVDINYKEAFMVLLLNNSLKLNGYSLISIGGLTGTLVDIRNIIQLALLSNSNSIIIAHNHPSGKLSPSNSDKVITNKIKEASKLFDIKLVDHLILTENEHYSFSYNNLI